MAILLEYRNKPYSVIDRFSKSEMKSILFETYISLGEMDSYEKVNERSKKFLSQLNSNISKEGYVLRKKTLTLINKLQVRYEAKEADKQ